MESAAAWGAGCALAWGLADICARFAGRSVGVLAATCTMMAVGGVLIAAIMAASGVPFDWRLDGIHWLVGIGAGTVLGSLLFYHAVTHGPVSLASPVVACYPAIAVPISVALGARPDPLHWGAMIATMAGVWLVARATASGDRSAPEYAPAVMRRTILYSLVAAAVYAASLTAADRAIDIYGPWQTVLVVRIFGFAGGRGDPACPPPAHALADAGLAGFWPPSGSSTPWATCCSISASNSPTASMRLWRAWATRW